MEKSFLAVALLLVSSPSCRAPSEGELEGAWVIAADSRDALPSEFRDVLGRVVLDADGSFQAEQLPTDKGPLPDLHDIDPILTGSGVWRLDVRGLDWQVLLSFQSVNGEEREFLLPLHVSSSVLSGPSLHFLWSDFDRGERVIVLRKE